MNPTAIVIVVNMVLLTRGYTRELYFRKKKGVGVKVMGKHAKFTQSSRKFYIPSLELPSPQPLHPTPCDPSRSDDLRTVILTVVHSRFQGQKTEGNHLANTRLVLP